MIGILGGMGPNATMDFYECILKSTPAKIEQDHIPTLIYSNPRVPDRTNSYLNCKNNEVVSALVEGAILLQNAGAHFLVIPCNTAHIYIDQIRQAIKIPIFDMIDQCVEYIVSHPHAFNKVALICTMGMYKSGIYQRKLSEKGIHCVIPEQDDQEKVMEAIYMIKRCGRNAEAIKLLDEIINRWDMPVVLGCTEISWLMKYENDHKFIINPSQILAEFAVRACINNNSV